MRGFGLKKMLKGVVYLLPLLVIHITAGSSYSANTSYDGATLYNTYCAACHDTGAGGALPIKGVEGKGDAVSITKNAITTNKSRAGVTTNMSAYSFLTDTQLQAITNYTYPTTGSGIMPVPTVQASIPTFSHIETPVISANIAAAYPIGVGNLNGGVLNWQVGLPVFSAAVDVVVAIQLGNTILFIDSNNSIAQSLTVWKTTSGSKINESITENLGISNGNLSIATSGLPAGTYTLYVAVLPAGNLAANNLSAFYLWSSQFTLQ